MEQLDYFYRAFEAYKKELANNRENYLFKKGANSKKSPDDFLSIISIDCVIEEDWILAIEHGMPFIAKAIKEDRQFIRNEGETLPIEKIRKVSKDSVVDLAKHSNYITKLPSSPQENIIPEKLLMVKRENDYAIYENRVLYATLLYLKNFITSRLNVINEAVNRYDGKCQIKKDVELGYRSVSFVLNIDELRKNDLLAIKKNKYHDLIERLNIVLNDVLLLMKTPLIVEVSKVALVTRPIVKTNVLKMNTNFKEALALFDFVAAYDKPGYTITKNEKVLQPLTPNCNDEFLDILLLSSFLTYEYNNEINGELKERYIEEEKRRKTESDNAILERIKLLHKKAKKSGKEIDEYMLLLEDGYKVLEKKIEEAKVVLSDTISKYEDKIVEININHKKEINEIEIKHNQEKEEIKSSYETQIITIKENHQKEIDDINASYDAQIEDIKTEKEEEIKRQQENFDNQISSLNETITNKENDITNLNRALEDKNKEVEVTTKEFNEKLDKLNEELKLARVENTTLRLSSDKKPNPEDYTSEERFRDLEEQKKLLDKFVEQSWKATKKSIKKELFKIDKPEKKKKKKGEK